MRCTFANVVRQLLSGAKRCRGTIFEVIEYLWNGQWIGLSGLDLDYVSLKASLSKRPTPTDRQFYWLEARLCHGPAQAWESESISNPFPFGIFSSARDAENIKTTGLLVRIRVTTKKIFCCTPNSCLFFKVHGLFGSTKIVARPVSNLDKHKEDFISKDKINFPLACSKILRQ